MQKNLCCLLLFTITGLAQSPAPIVMRGDRFKPIAAADFTPEQKAFIDEVQKSPNPTTSGPYNMLLRSPDLGRVAHEFGAYPRFRSSVPAKLNELAIMMAVRQWNSEFVWSAHRRAAQ